MIDIADFKNKENIRSIYFNLDVEGIDISRFNEQCSICNKTGYGPTSKCEKSGCNNRFHVECARINKLHLESISVNYEYKYFIYCHSHKPHFLVKATEVKKQKKREEILKYAELLERHMDTVYRYDRKHYHKIQGLKINLRDSSALSGRLLLNKKRRRANSKDYNANLIYVHLDKKEKRILALKVRETYNKLNSMEIGIRKDYEKPNKTNNEKTVELKISNLIGLSSKLTQAENKPEGSNNPDSLNVNKPSQPTDDNAIEKRESSLKDIHFMTIPSHQAEQYEIIKKYPKRILFSYKDTLDPKKFPWYMLENTCGLPAKEVYIAYRHIICPDEVSFMKKIQRKTHKKIQQIQTKFINAINKNSMLKRVTHVKDGNKHEYVEYGEDTNLYCFCQRKYLEDDFMVSCSNENNCRFNGWFHPECVEALRALTKEEIEKSDFEFTCEFCLKHTHEDSGEIVNNLIGIPAKDHAEVDCEGLANGGIGGNCDLLKQPFDGKSDGFGSKRSGDCAEDSHK